MKCAILGGGISGLSVAHYMRKMGIKHEIILLEASNRLGGLIESSETPSKSLFISGPKTIRVNGKHGPNTLQLIENLQIENVIIPFTRGIMPKYIKLNSDLVPVRVNFSNLFLKTPLINKALLSPILRELRAPKGSSDDESVHSFFFRRFGPEVADNLADAITIGIFAGSSKELSMKSTFSNIHELEQMHGSLIKSTVKNARSTLEKILQRCADCEATNQILTEKWESLTFVGGIQTLIDGLETDIAREGIQIKLNSAVVDIVKGNKVVVKTANDSYSVDYVVSAIPANQLKRLVTNMCPSLGQELSSIPYVTMGVVNLEFEEDCLIYPGFGYLVPSNQKDKVLGVIFDSCIHRSRKKTVVTVLMGGLWFKEHFGSSPTKDELLKVALEEVSSTLRIKVKPVQSRVSILKDCIPQYIVGHHTKIAKFDNIIKENDLPLFLTGNSYNGVGVGDSIMDAKRTADLLKTIYNK